MSKRKLVAAVLSLAYMMVVMPGARAADEDPVVQGKKLSEWIALLKTATPNEIIEVTDAIGKAGPKADAAVPALIEVMQKGGQIAYYADNTLEKIGKAAVPALIEVTKGKNEVAGSYAASLLRRKFPEDAKKAGLGSIAEETAQMKKLTPAKELKGTSWFYQGGSDAAGGVTTRGPEGSKIWTLTFGEDNAEWKSLPLVSKQPGQGKYAVDTKKDPAQIELQVDKKAYKGIYSVAKQSDGFILLKLQLSAAGGDYPTELVKDFRVPKGSKETLLTFVRVK